MTSHCNTACACKGPPGRRLDSSCMHPPFHQGHFAMVLQNTLGIGLPLDVLYILVCRGVEGEWIMFYEIAERPDRTGTMTSRWRPNQVQNCRLNEVQTLFHSGQQEIAMRLTLHVS